MSSRFISNARPEKARSVFINCPFDQDYQPLLRGICFAILACGYVPRCALDFSDSGALRFPEIVKIITQCARSIHDISRVDLDQHTKLPRFNMPLELGADLGLRLAGGSWQRERKTLVLDAEKHRYDKTLSDISGMDIEGHSNQVPQAIKHVRDWLNANRGDAPILPGAGSINADHTAYLKLAPSIIDASRLDPHDDLPHGDYLYVVEQALPLIERARGASVAVTPP
jgi:hypothetical protein